MRQIIIFALFAISVLFILRKPFLGIIIYAAINIVRLEMLVWGGYDLNKIYFLTFAITGIASIINSKNFKIKYIFKSNVFLILLLYLSCLISWKLSIYNIPDAKAYIDEIFKIFLYCFLLLVLINEKEKILKYENVLLICMVLVGIWGIEQHFRGNVRLEGLGAGRDSNGVAALFVMFYPLAFSKIFIAKNNRDRLIGTFSLLIMVLIVIFTQSRGGFLGLAICTFLIIIKSNKRFVILLIMFVTTFISSFFISEDYKQRMLSINSKSYQQDSSAESRLILWRAGLMVFEDNPLIGAGFFSFPYAKMQYKEKFHDIDPMLKEEVFREQNPYVTHNTYIQLLAEEGIIGFLLFSLLLFGNFYQNFRYRIKLPKIPENEDLYNLLTSVEIGIIGFCICIVFISSISNMFLFIQLTISYLIRQAILYNLTTSFTENSQNTQNAFTR